MFAAAAPRSDDLEEPTLEAPALERARSSSTHAVCKVPAIAGPDSPGSAPAGCGQDRVSAARSTRPAVGDLDLRAAGSAGQRGIRPRGRGARAGLGWEGAGPAALRARGQSARGAELSAAGGGASSAAFLGGRCAERARADPAPAAEPLWARQAPGAARRKHRLRARWAGRNWSGFSEGPREPQSRLGKAVGLGRRPLPGPGHGVRPNLGERVCYRVSASVSVEPAACI